MELVHTTTVDSPVASVTVDQTVLTGSNVSFSILLLDFRTSTSGGITTKFYKDASTGDAYYRIYKGPTNNYLSVTNGLNLPALSDPYVFEWHDLDRGYKGLAATMDFARVGFSSAFNMGTGFSGGWSTFEKVVVAPVTGTITAGKILVFQGVAS